MGKGIQDIGNGLGYIYVTDPSGNIQYTYENTPDNARQVKLDGVKASSFGGNRAGTSIITVDAPTGVGSIANITVDGSAIIDVGIPLTYTEATTAVALAQDIVDAINRYEKGAGFPKHKAVRFGAVVYLFSDTARENGQTPVLVNTGKFTYTVDQDIEGGSSNSEVWDEAIGYNFYLDADYGATQCSGGGVATVDSIANAVDITSFIVNIGLQSSLPETHVTVSSNTIIIDRKSFMTIVNLTGEGAADDDLENIIVEGVSDRDILILVSLTNTITAKTLLGNISLQSGCAVNGGDVLALVYSEDAGLWVELYRSKMEVADNAVTTGKVNDLAITTAKIDDLAVTTAKIDSAAVTVSKVETTLKTELLLVPISWDTNRIGDHKVVIPYPCTVNQIDVYADDLIEATDDADANFKNNAGLSMGTVTFSGGDTIGTGYSVTPSSNNTFTAGQVLTITTTKSTVGGNAKASIKVTKS